MSKFGKFHLLLYAQQADNSADFIRYLSLTVTVAHNTQIALMKYIVIGILAVVAIGFLINSVTKKRKLNSPKTALTEKSNNQNRYMEMRNIAFSAKADQIGLENIPEDKVYGLITEMGMNPGSATVVSFLTGDTSLYLSSGGGFIGAGQHEDVREIVKEKVNGFQQYLIQAKKIDKPQLPTDGTVNFNFLTRNGLYSVTEKMSDLESGNSELSNLFMEVNEIITHIRLKSKQ